MDKKHMTFDIDRHSVTEGDVVEVRWDCAGGERVHLVIDNGFRTTDIPLDPCGTKRFRLNRSKGRTRLTIGATILGKEHTKTHRVSVKKMPVLRAETLDHHGRPQNVLRRWRQGMMTKWHTFRRRLRMATNQLPERKQTALRALLILSAMLFLCLFWPRLYSLALLAVMVYLAVVLLRR